MTVKVKPLEWKQGATAEKWFAEAFGRPMYEVGTYHGKIYWLHNWRGLAQHTVASIGEAKAAAQADYEARILSALTNAQGGKSDE